MIIIIDNYDSFSYNLYQMIGTTCPELEVVRNDRETVEELAARKPDGLILSPGPGRPEEAGICVDAVRYFAPRIPILGVCLGHQAIGYAYGGHITYARQLMHGKTSMLYRCDDSPLFEGLPNQFEVARYHSLAVAREGLPSELVISAQTCDGEIMALRHREYEVYGIQFHPESILTPNGALILQRFLSRVAKREVVPSC